MDFLYTTSPIMLRWQGPRADKTTKIISKVAQEDFGNTSKKSYWLHLPFFFTNFFRPGRVVPPHPLDAIDRPSKHYGIYRDEHWNLAKAIVFMVKFLYICIILFTCKTCNWLFLPGYLAQCSVHAPMLLASLYIRPYSLVLLFTVALYSISRLIPNILLQARQAEALS